MVTRLLVFVSQVIISVISTGGYAGIVLLMAIESANIPLPSEIIMPFSGFLVGQGRFAFWPAVLAGAIGGTLGSLGSYALGYWGGEAVVRKLIKRWGKYLLIFEYELDEAMDWFKKHGQLVTFTSRLLPVVRTFISLPAGMSRMNVKKFTFFAFLGTFIWSLPLAYLGKVLGDNWHSLGGYFHKFDLLIVVLGLSAVVFYVYHKLKKHERYQKAKTG